MPHRQIWDQIWWTGRLQSPAHCHKKYGKQLTEFAGVVSCCTGMLGRGGWVGWGHRFSRNRTDVRIYLTYRYVLWCRKKRNDTSCTSTRHQSQPWRNATSRINKGFSADQYLFTYPVRTEASPPYTTSVESISPTSTTCRYQFRKFSFVSRSVS